MMQAVPHEMAEQLEPRGTRRVSEVAELRDKYFLKRTK